jgi:hypothetical protein
LKGSIGNDNFDCKANCPAGDTFRFGSSLLRLPSGIENATVGFVGLSPSVNVVDLRSVQVPRALQLPDVAIVVQQVLLFRDLCLLIARVLVSFARHLGQFVNLCF